MAWNPHVLREAEGCNCQGYCQGGTEENSIDTWVENAGKGHVGAVRVLSGYVLKVYLNMKSLWRVADLERAHGMKYSLFHAVFILLLFFGLTETKHVLFGTQRQSLNANPPEQPR